MFGDVSLSIAEDQRALIQCLVSCKSHFQVVSDFHQEEPSLRQVDSRLTDDFIEQLSMQFLSNGTDASLPGLFFLKPLLEKILKQIEFLSTGLIWTDAESEELALMLENVRLEHFVEQIRVFGVEICCSYRIKNGFAFVKLIIQELLF